MLDPTQAPATLAELAQRSFVGFAARPCLGHKDGKAYEFLSYEAVAQRARNLAAAWQELGLARGERVAILAENAPEWAICDFACQLLGVISVPLFSTLPAVQIQGILRDCGAKFIVVSDAAQAKKVAQIRGELPACERIFSMEKIADEPTQTLAELEMAGSKYLQQHPQTIETTWPAAEPDDAATIIYTSGTTGEPKGVILSHRNLIANIEAICDWLREALGMDENEVFLSFLPLAHIFERTAGFWVPMRLGASVAYCQSLRTVDKNMREVRPTCMMAVPRFYEMLHDKIVGAADDLPENKRGKYLHALALARKSGAQRGGVQGATTPNLWERVQLAIYDRVVYSKVRERFGGRLKAFIAGGAPMPPALAQLFLGMNITILEGYGLTETSPVIAVNRPPRIQLGTVGEVLPNVEIKIEGDGEICVRGPSITRGYWQRETETREAIDNENWFHTGDIGQLVEKGGRKYLQITDRKKDLLVLANGKKVAPAPIEMRLSQSDLISQVVLLGDHLKAVSALIVPQMEALRLFAAKQNLALQSDAEILQSPAILKRMREEIDAVSKDLADFEKVKKFTLLPHPFSVENGEMTPTLKIKRRVVAEKYGELLEV